MQKIMKFSVCLGICFKLWKQTICLFGHTNTIHYMAVFLWANVDGKGRQSLCFQNVLNFSWMYLKYILNGKIPLKIFVKCCEM